jgi:3-methyl-2-oxobutanoate hydroxymethyltransferase
MSKEGRVNKINTAVIRDMKKKGHRITMLTAYDYPTASVLDEAGIDILLVGDSLGMVVLGYESTIPVTMDDMVHHTKAVARAARRSMVIADMPFLSYQCSADAAVQNAGRLLQEGGAHGVKLEGGAEIANLVRRICAAGIPVQAHVGLTPQAVHQLGGYKVQGKEDAAARKIIDDAIALQEAGAFSIVIESVPARLAEEITVTLTIPTIGIGAGVHCDGQVLVIHDVLGMFERFTPKFAKRYAEVNKIMREAVTQYAEEVRSGSFPDKDHSY